MIQKSSTPNIAKRTALVTGAAHGIGWAICQRLAADGFRIALADIDAATIHERIQSLGPGHAAIVVDLTDIKATAGLVAKAAQKLEHLDVIVNNAGATDSSGLGLTAISDQSFERLLALNLTAVETICATAKDILRPGGKVINIASGAAYRPLALRGPYSATKAGIVALTEALASEYVANGITVIGVAPGYTRTPLVEALHKSGRVDLDKVMASIPLGRLALPTDIASVVGFAAGCESQFLSGQTLVVDGGISMGPAPAGAGPVAGTASSGRLAVLGPLDIEGCLVDAIDQQRLGTIETLSIVIDSEPFAACLTAAETLRRARLTAQICAEHSGRTSDFSLLFVSPEGTTPAAKVAAACRAMLAQTLALEWAASGIRVNALSWSGTTQIGLSAICRFLSGPDAAYLTGQHLLAGDPTTGCT